MYRRNALSPDARIYIAGHHGLVGSAVWRHFSERGFPNLLGRSSDQLDLRDSSATSRYMADVRPDVVINAAGVVGGIAANINRPADFFSDNLRIQLNLLDSSLANGVERFLFLGSSCIYPKLAPQPVREDALLTGPLEETNEAFAMAKLAGLSQVAAIRRQHGLPYICAMPTNLYGPGDNFKVGESHVLPAMIRRFDQAVRDGVDNVVCWGTGRPRREFLYVDDLADACRFLLDSYDDDRPINVGTGFDLSIAELAVIVADVVGYRGGIQWDTGKPDGTYQKRLDVHRLNALGWLPNTTLVDGVRRTYRWFVEHRSDCRR